MTKRMHAACHVVGWLLAMGEDDARSSESAGHDPGRHDSVPDRAGSLIARARDYRGAGLEPSLTSSLGSGRARDLARLVDSWKNAAIEAELVDQFKRPAPLDHVEQSSARSVRDVARIIAREMKPDVVFGQQHPPDTIEESRLVVADPEELWQSEAGQDRVSDGLKY